MLRHDNSTCPKCGQNVAPEKLPGFQFIAATGKVRYGGKVTKLSPLEIDLIEILYDAYPRGVSLDNIFLDLYGDRVEGEEPCRKILHVMPSHIRSKFRRASIPLDLVSRRGWGDRSGYALVRTDE